jgi:hypothetical protein
MQIRGRDRLITFNPADGVADDGVGILPLPEPVSSPRTGVIEFDLTVDDDSGMPNLVVTLSTDKVQELADAIRVEPSTCKIETGSRILELEIVYAE